MLQHLLAYNVIRSCICFNEYHARKCYRKNKEIGTRKAIGATSKTVRQQFLMEAIVICQIGGVVGIILGILIGNITSILIDSAFVIPWIWLGAGIIYVYLLVLYQEFTLL